MATSTTTQTASSLGSNAGSLPRRSQTNGNPAIQKPKLTGWAQAAARSLPKSQQQLQNSSQGSSPQEKNNQSPINVAKSNSGSSSNGNNNANNNSTNNRNTSPSLRKPRKQTNSNNGNNNSGVNNTNNTNNSNSNSNNNNSNNNAYNKPRQPYNREEVRKYMKDLFSHYTFSSTSISTYNSLANSRKGNNLDWGAVTNNKHKNKKYGCLNEIAQALRT